MKNDFDPFAERVWQLANGVNIKLGPKALIMGVVNVTPDSFSDGDLYNSVDAAVLHAMKLRNEGADIIDIGGESTKPGADAISAEVEQSRVLPIINAVAQVPGLIISIDTYRYSTAKLAIENGAHIVNDVWGCQKEPEIAGLVAESSVGLCAMHNGRNRELRADVVQDQVDYLNRSLNLIKAAGVSDNQIVLDPGFGFGKTHETNIELLGRFDELHTLGYPLLVGTSRKRFVGYYTNKDVNDRDIGTAATNVVARMKGGAIFRVHDVPSTKDALAIADAVLSGQGNAL